MALDSSILSWNISWTEKSGWLQAMGSYRVRHNWKTEHTHITSVITKTGITVYVDVFVVAQSLSCVRLFVTPWTAAGQASLSITNSGSLLKLMSIESVMPSNHLILCCLLLPPSIFPDISVFSNESVLHIRWSKYQSFSFSISPSNEHSGLISFRMDWGLISFQSKGLSRIFSNATVQKHQFFGLSLWSNSHIHTWLLEKP